MKITAITIIAAIFIFALSETALACRCRPPEDPVSEREKSEAVFSGRVIEIKSSAANLLEVVFEAEKHWKGTDKSRVSVFTMRDSSACGYTFKRGDDYLVYAGRDDKDRLITNLCTRTKALDDAGEDLEALGKGRETGKEANRKTEKGYIGVDEGTRIFYEKVGTGAQTVVVPLHLYMFEDFKHLAIGRTMIFYDVRNRGASDPEKDAGKLTIHEDVEDLEKLRRHFGLKKFSLIGESYTGLMVVMYAMKYPQHVEKIVQIGAVPLKFGTEYPKELTANDETPVPDPAEFAPLDKLREEGFHKTNPREFCEKDWAVIRKMLVGRPELAEKVASPCRHPNEWAESLDRHLSNHFVSVQKLDIPREEVAKVKVPVLTIHGTKDRNAPYGAGKEWSEILPNARLLTVRGAAHLPWIEEPELVFGAIESFLGSR